MSIPLSQFQDLNPSLESEPGPVTSGNLPVNPKNGLENSCLTSLLSGVKKAFPVDAPEGNLEVKEGTKVAGNGSLQDIDMSQFQAMMENMKSIDPVKQEQLADLATSINTVLGEACLGTFGPFTSTFSNPVSLPTSVSITDTRPFNPGLVSDCRQLSRAQPLLKDIQSPTSTFSSENSNLSYGSHSEVRIDQINLVGPAVLYQQAKHTKTDYHI
ncbi:uncharacterized protein LOC143253986 [Tachypleus tridentatus]|uniref:uncharacterized protein LOC143253986 n=1 Tax=Tachypleus tridentatus TaxID=6853 RepID=UPI003FD3D5ED